MPPAREGRCGARAEHPNRTTFPRRKARTFPGQRDRGCAEERVGCRVWAGAGSLGSLLQALELLRPPRRTPRHLGGARICSCACALGGLRRRAAHRRAENGRNSLQRGRSPQGQYLGRPTGFWLEKAEGPPDRGSGARSRLELRQEPGILSDRGHGCPAPPFPQVASGRLLPHQDAWQLGRARLCAQGQAVLERLG